MYNKINALGIKKICILILISISIVSCGNETNNGEKIENDKQQNIAENKISNDNNLEKKEKEEDKKLIEENSGATEADKLITDSGSENLEENIDEKNKNEIIDKQLEKDNNFANLDRDSQIKIAEKIDCKKEFKSPNAIQECLWSKADLVYDKYNNLNNEDKLKYNCSNLLVLPKEDTEYKRYYEECLHDKQYIKENLEKEKLRQKIKLGDLSYCQSKFITSKKDFDLDKCKISVIAQSEKKNCNVLPSSLRSDCEEVKAEVIKIEAEKARKRKIRGILNAIDL